MGKIVAVIPARGGSKSIPQKNIMDFCGKPLIAWSIEQALNAEHIDSVWVSSDDDAILDVAKSYGAQAIKRPETISGDHATSESAWVHALGFLTEQSMEVDLMVGMQATSPVRESNDLDGAVTLFQEKNCDSLFSGSILGVFYIWEESNPGDLCSVNYDYKARQRRQDIKQQYVENGSFYLFKPAVLREYNNRLGGKIAVFPMPMWKAFEIDEKDDARFCEVLMRAYLMKEVR